jgi:sugar/nucleoside kinase (ribokinase family)
MRITATVVGDALLDVIVTPAGPMRTGADVPAEVRIAPGGQGANLAVRLARRGVDVGLVCALGDDLAADLVRGALEREGVSLHEVRVAATGSVVVLVGSDGERTMLSQRAPFGAVPMRIPAADWLVVSGYLLLEPGAEARAAGLAARPGRRALAGCAVPDELVDAWRAAASALRPDLVVANREEAHRLALAADALITTDATGARGRIGQVVVAVDTPPGPAAVDTTGAGDAFAATFLASVAGAWPPDRDALAMAVEAAMAAGAATTRVIGAQSRIPGEPAARLDR